MLMNSDQFLERLRAYDVEVSTIIHVGAADGQWAAMAQDVFPDSRCHLIEANPYWKPQLDQLAATRPNVSFTMAAAGPVQGEARLKLTSNPRLGFISGQGYDSVIEISVPMVRLYDEVTAHNLQPPYLLRIDCNGFDHEIIQGGQGLLMETSVLIAACYNIAPDVERQFPSIIEYYEKFGFRMMDLIDPEFRPLDSVLWKFDALFLRWQHPHAKAHVFATPELPFPSYAELYTLVSMDHLDALGRIANRGIEIGTIIDVGAARGTWSVSAKPIFPQAHCHLIEAKTYWQEELDTLTRERSDFTYTLAAAGAHEGETLFVNTERPYGGWAAGGFTDGSETDMVENVRMITIDNEIRRHDLKPPYLIKLDTHGTEREILAGAIQAMNNCHLLVVECYNWGVVGERRFTSMIQYFETFGMKVVDVGDIMARPYDRALWSLDLCLVKAHRPECENFAYAG